MPLRINALALLASPLLALGCGQAETRAPVYPASGTVLQDGKPLAGATVLFHPAAAPAGPTDDPAAAIRVTKTDDQGKYALSTYEANDGAPAGDYVVTVEPAGSAGPSVEEVTSPTQTARIPASLSKFAKKETSPLKATVKPGDNPPFDFDLR